MAGNMKKISGGKNLKGSGTIKYEEEIIMEMVLSIVFGAWFVASALFYGYMVKNGEKE